MSKFRRTLPNDEIETSESENEECFGVLTNYEDRSLSPPSAKKRKRQIKLPKRLSEYETEGAVDKTEDELCKYAVHFNRFESILKSWFCWLWHRC